VSERALDPAIVDAYLGAVDWLRSILGRSEVAYAWPERSAVADYTVGGIAAHAVHGVLWLEQLLMDPEPAGLRRVTIVEFFGTNRVDGPDDHDSLSASLRAAAEAFALAGASAVNAACTVSRDVLVGLLKTASADRAVPVIRLAGGQVSLEDYLRTRVLEVVVHGDDVASSVSGRVEADPPPAAVEISLGVCIEMARVRVGDVGALRAFTRAERSEPGALRVL
jgi:hypothetical protein